MGHAIEYFTYSADTDKKRIENEMNIRAMEDGDYHSGLNKAIRWMDVICENEQKAYEYIKAHDDGWYNQLAVKYRVYPKSESTKTLLNLEERLKKERTKKADYEKAHSISSFKIEYIGCPKCGSKLKRTLLRNNGCPLCGKDLRSKTTLDTLARYENNIRDLVDRICEEQRKIDKKNIAKSKIRWLVKIEYHV